LLKDVLIKYKKMIGISRCWPRTPASIGPNQLIICEPKHLGCLLHSPRLTLFRDPYHITKESPNFDSASV
jgi:hypothetical protein